MAEGPTQSGDDSKVSTLDIRGGGFQSREDAFDLDQHTHMLC